MTTSACWRLSVHNLPEAEEPISQLLERIFNLSAVAYRKEEAATVQVSVFLDQDPCSMPREVERLRIELSELVQSGFLSKSGRISVRKLKKQDWAESWKRHFKSFEVNEQLLIRPSWSRRKPRKGQSVLTLDPGLSFGTGQHPTTAFCLRQIGLRRAMGASQSLLDVGTGSGILALAAASLGYSPVKAFDYDPEAIRIAISNAKLNQLEAKVQFSVASLDDVSPSQAGQHSVVCANLEAPLLIQQAKRLAHFLLPNGYLMVAGILVNQFPSVSQAISAQGLKKVISEKGPQWESGLFRLG